MGVYSEMDIDLRYGGSPFEEDGALERAEEQTIPAFTEAAPVEPAGAPSVVEPVVSQPQQDVEDTTPATSVPAQEADTALAETPGDTGKPAEAAADVVSEDDKKKAHEEAEAKRKAEYDARQAPKQAAEKEQLDRLAAMSDEDVLTASMNRVSTDTEKLTRRNMKECVAEYIQTMCIEDLAFARRVMHPRKSMIRCFQYISRKAWDYVQDELKANGIKPGPGQQAYGCDVPDDLCYQWAVDYFNDPDVKEDHEDEEKFEPKPYVGGSTTKNKGNKTAKGKTGDKKADTPKKAVAKETPKQTAAATGQISLGDFMMPEEKAG
ncbi:MAG: hypothetical protein HDT37_06920 [Clostridiales bacterium]|nr:hypothetical protein [Clostridiales bacterium]